MRSTVRPYRLGVYLRPNAELVLIEGPKDNPYYDCAYFSDNCVMSVGAYLYGGAKVDITDCEYLGEL